MPPNEPPTAEQTTTQPNRGGAPKGSRNAIRHGLKSSGLPRGCRRIESDVNEFRRTLEDAVQAARGSVGVVDAATISRAARWETHGRLAGRWLMLESDTLPAAERLRFAGEVTRAAVQRDRAVADLELDGKLHRSLWPMPNANNGHGDA